MSKISEFKPIEPLMSNRFIIKFNEEVTIPEYLFRNFKIYNEGESLIFRTEMYQTVNYSFNPSDLFKMTSVTIHYLDPVGEVVNGLKFKPKGSNMKYKNDYGDDGLSIVKFQFIVDSDSITLLNKNTEL
jgi:hypothetical protein